ncbi:AIPR family protein [Streptomyces zaomyceticus]|uniref:AIPR family protein n=1 Tax=Streptomyces zaomyceticus TaxID=68286 RepID=UPI0033BF91F5
MTRPEDAGALMDTSEAVGVTSAQTVAVIRDALKRDYEGLIDLEDVKGRRSPAEIEMVFSARALAAMALQIVTGCPPEQAATSVTDGFDDQGIDAIGYSASAPELWLVQAKWSHKGTARFGVDGALKLLHGLRQLDNRAFDRFNPRVRQHAERVGDILESPECRVHLVVAVMGEKATKEQARTVIEQAAADFDAAVECHVLALHDFQAASHRDALTRNAELTATLLGSWHTRDIPYRMFTGLVGADEIALWYQEHGASLFDRNVRGNLGGTSLNLGLIETLRTAPEAFSYLHNGITVLCDAVETEYFARLVEGAPARLHLKGAAVVNGAQTVASIYHAMHGEHRENISLAAVPLRVISLANTPEDFARSVITATHAQHHINGRDFVALDQVQLAIREDFRATLGKSYAARRGELIPAPSAGCSFEEAAVALACGHPDASLSALACASTEHLWDMTPQGAYARLFGRRPSALQIWRSVLLLRAVREALHQLKSGLQGRHAAIADRGDLLIAHLVFRLTDDEEIDDPEAEWDRHLSDAASHVGQVLAALIAQVDDLFGDRAFVAQIFPSTERCRLLAVGVLKTLAGADPVPQLRLSAPRRQPRKPNSVRLLVERRRIPDGTQMLYQPGPVEEEAIGHWLDEDPRRYVATWSNDRQKPLRWAADDLSYSPSGLISHIWQSAGWREAWSAVQGPRYWTVPGEGSLADIADALWDIDTTQDAGE